jgi:hypothetical protein
LIPIVICHFFPIGAEPDEVLDLRPSDASALEELASPENRMFATERDQLAGEGEEFTSLPVQLPVKPTELIVLAVCIIVSPLRPIDLVASTDHRNALRKKKGGQHIAFLLLS